MNNYKWSKINSYLYVLNCASHLQGGLKGSVQIVKGSFPKKITRISNFLWRKETLGIMLFMPSFHRWVNVLLKVNLCRNWELRQELKPSGTCPSVSDCAKDIFDQV
jgi:hypothetical protein